MERLMEKGTPPTHRAGGFLIAMFTFVGTGLGVAMGQPSIGVLAGVGFGAGLALLLWLRDRSR